MMNYCQVISILANNRDRYYGNSFVLTNKAYEVFYPSRNQDVYRIIESYAGQNSLFKEDNRGTTWLYWFDGHEEIINSAKKLETLIIQDIVVEKQSKKRLSQKQTPKQKLLHAGSFYRMANQHIENPETMLLLLVSAIEYLLTRNPDSNRFNVEDSISKQFKLKCGIIIHLQDSNYDLPELNKKLQKTYSQRSDLAHGNYKEDFDMQDVADSVFELFKFNKHIVNEYIDDRNLVDYLKDN